MVKSLFTGLITVIPKKAKSKNREKVKVNYFTSSHVNILKEKSECIIVLSKFLKPHGNPAPDTSVVKTFEIT